MGSAKNRRLQIVPCNIISSHAVVLTLGARQRVFSFLFPDKIVLERTSEVRVRCA